MKNKQCFDYKRSKYNLLCLYVYIDVLRPLTNDLWVFLFQMIDAEYVNEPVRLEHMCMSKLL